MSELEVRPEYGGALLARVFDFVVVGVGGPVEGLDLEALRLQFEVNLFGQVRVSQAFLPLLRTGAGRVVNMSSR